MNLAALTPTPTIMAVFGLLVLAIIVFQMLVGYRKIAFKGRTHLRVHKWIAWGLVAVAVLHGLGGLLYLGIL